VKAILLIFGCAVIHLPKSSPPVITLNTPGGRNWLQISPSFNIVSGVYGDGLMMMQLPVINAGAIFQMASSTGKFHGTMPPTTPSGV
jgi:hypothetical protein